MGYNYCYLLRRLLYIFVVELELTKYNNFRQIHLKCPIRISEMY